MQRKFRILAVTAGISLAVCALPHQLRSDSGEAPKRPFTTSSLLEYARKHNIKLPPTLSPTNDKSGCIGLCLFIATAVAGEGLFTGGVGGENVWCDTACANSPIPAPEGCAKEKGASVVAGGNGFSSSGDALSDCQRHLSAQMNEYPNSSLVCGTYPTLGAWDYSWNICIVPTPPK